MRIIDSPTDCSTPVDRIDTINIQRLDDQPSVRVVRVLPDGTTELAMRTSKRITYVRLTRDQAAAIRDALSNCIDLTKE
jgi:hypothetical protein